MNEENEESTTDTEKEEDDSGDDKIQALVQLLAWAGGLWFFTVHMVM